MKNGKEVLRSIYIPGRRAIREQALEGLARMKANGFTMGDWSSPGNFIVENDSGEILPVDFGCVVGKCR